jgi:hypothetical protein
MFSLPPHEGFPVYQMHTGGSVPGVKLLENEADYSFQNVKDMNMWSFTYIHHLYALLEWCFGMGTLSLPLCMLH